MRMPRRRVQRNLDAAAQAHAIRRHHHWSRTQLDRLRHVLERAHGQLNLLPLAILHRQQKLHQVRANRKICPLAGDDESLKVRNLLARRLQCLHNQRDDIVAQRIHLGVQFNRRHPIPQVDHRRTRILPHHAPRRLDRSEAGSPLWRNHRLVSATHRIEKQPPRRNRSVVLVPCGLTRSASQFKQLLHIRRNRLPRRAHLLRSRAHTRCVEHLKRSKLPIEAGFHSNIDLNNRFCNRVRHRWNPIRRIRKQLSQQRPIESPRLILLRVGSACRGAMQ